MATGSTKLFGPSMPMAGSQRSSTAKSSASITPSQKLGVACAIEEKIRAIRSNQPFGRSAAAMPMANESTVVITMLTAPSANVFGTASSTVSSHRAPAPERGAQIAPHEVAEEGRRTARGSACRCRAARRVSLSTDSGVPGGSISRAGSPGTSRTAKKVTVTTPNTTTIICRVR